MKKLLLNIVVVFLCGALFLLMVSSAAHATLMTIGTAQFGGADTEYNLIWDDDNNGNSVVWLDFTNDATNWSAQNAWAAGLDSALTINLYTGYSVTWDSAWRLPSTVDGLYSWGYDGSTTVGYNITSSEMGHLFYTELGNKGYYAIDGSNPQPGYGLTNTGDFENLIADWYWSGTEFATDPSLAWDFGMNYGVQNPNGKSNDDYGLAVRSGQVSMAAPVPEPTTCLLFGVGLLGLAGISRRKKGSRC